MLTKIREKAQGVFAWVILILITVPFALWGIQNYLDVGKEAPVASVGSKDFFQKDLTRAYEQYSQSLKNTDIDEESLKSQALQKLIKDEVLLQHVNSLNLVISDETARSFITSLDYFQTDGKFDKRQYQALLNSQGMSSSEFISRIKNALTMEQFQRAVVENSFATQYDLESFFKIQNQQRDVEYVTVALKKITEQPSDEVIEAYFQQHMDAYQKPEQVSVEYLELSLDALANEVVATDQQLKAFYEEQKDFYTTKERRKISHILFAVNDKTDDAAALQKAKDAQQQLANQAFAELAKSISDDTLTAKNGGDLGLFEAGVMEKAFEDAALSLKLNEVSEPVKSSFGYHLITVTELVKGESKPFETVKDELTKTYQKKEAETRFYELGERLTELSYENADNLNVASDSLGIKTKTTDLFTKDNGQGIASELKVRNAAFSEEVLKGNNSEPVELDGERLVVLRLLKHEPAASRKIDEVRQDIIQAILIDKAKQQTVEQAALLSRRLQDDESVDALAKAENLPVKTYKGLTRLNMEIPFQLSQAIFKAAKPVAGKPVIFTVPLESGDQVIVSLQQVKPGEMSDEDKKQAALASKNLANVFGQAYFNDLLNSLEQSADIAILKK
ncbi:SurA N-terminal domain-containing protein [Methylicorpusculum sp.]|uniref:SurA N-terminal domain-containing protein n=3 Tax=Methylicorpusculum sp. TaxID=2713644 RepID=UPI0027305407|nr:SurA N-terminal domain-containing protein [Methylicorpusculum sp.]MDP2178406.1 SurA N-terminal domain-containing protein [Methylicorpusculum sp.]MDP3530758.1 SurA N-terminal domain-containing protein [Methylicorpusculum sp.]